MDPMLVQYIVFILAALILIGAVVALNKRLSRRNRSGPDILNTWAKLDTGQADARENLPTVFDEVDEEDAKLHARSRQNGHHAESQKPQS